MADNEMQIILTLIDKATADLKKVKEEISGTQKPLNDVKKKGEETNKSLQDGFKESSSHARTFRRDVFLVVGIFSEVVAATREYAKYNKEAAKSVDEFDLSIQQLQINIGKLFTTKIPMGPGILSSVFGVKEMSVLDIINKTVDGYQKIMDLVSNAAGGKGVVLTDSDEIEKIITAGQVLKRISEEQQQINNEFISGKISIEEYYTQISNGSFFAISARQQEMQLLRDMGQLQFEVANKGLMDEQNSIEQRIGLLKYYEEIHKQATFTMAQTTVFLGKTIQQNLGTALTSIIMQTKSSKEAFKEMGIAMLTAIVEFMVQKLIAWALEKTLLAGTTASQLAYIAAVLPGMTALALATNIATGGAAGVAAAASSTSAGVAFAGAMGVAAAGATAASRAGAPSIGVTMQDSSGNISGDFPNRFAEGGSGIVSRPTLFLAGEAGPERFNFTPVGKESGVNRVSNFYLDINIDSPVVSKEADLDYLTEEISRKLSREIERIR
jgi:hypothetical protein